MKHPPTNPPRMHTILMDWLVEVGKEFQLLVESVYLGASLVDRYLSTENVERGELQLLGTCLL